MVGYELLKIENGILFYNYFPEWNGAPGIISLNINTEEAESQKFSEDDRGGKYAFKVYSHLKKCISDKEYKEKGSIIWC